MGRLFVPLSGYGIDNWLSSKCFHGRKGGQRMKKDRPDASIKSVFPEGILN